MSIPDQDSFRQAQAKHWPREDLSAYMGRWVAIRDGKVVASDLSLSALRRQPEVEPTDNLMPVPRSRPGFLIVPLQVPPPLPGHPPIRFFRETV
jgi:hypothetical protein